MSKARLAIYILLVVVAADQLSKWWLLTTDEVPPLRELALSPLPAVAYGRTKAGLLRGIWGSLGLLVVAIRLIGALAGWLRRTESRRSVMALGAVTGGVVSNVVDVIRIGSLAGYAHPGIAARWPHYPWYVFNLADAAILCGTVVLLVEFWRRP
jgi:isoleucyl-tRNA synthetase/signal peptidase II